MPWAVGELPARAAPAGSRNPGGGIEGIPCPGQWENSLPARAAPAGWSPGGRIGGIPCPGQWENSLPGIVPAGLLLQDAIQEGKSRTFHALSSGRTPSLSGLLPQDAVQEGELQCLSLPGTGSVHSPVLSPGSVCAQGQGQQEVPSRWRSLPRQAALT